MKKRIAFILIFAVMAVMLCCCGRDSGGDNTEVQLFECAPVRFREYVHFTTNSELPFNKVFSTYDELEEFVMESGLLRDSLTSNTNSMNGLLNFFSRESFDENVVVLLIAPRGDLRYRGDVSHVSGNKESIEIVFDCNAGKNIEVEDYYSLSVALMIPKEYCDADTEFAFVSENFEQPVYESE